jgi:anti-anti-sigma regulatory factor
MLTLENPAAVARIASRGRLDPAEARRLKRAVAASAAASVVLDLSGVGEIDAVGLGAVLAIDSACAAAGRSLLVVPPDGAAREPLMLLGGFGRLEFAELDARVAA